MPTPKETLSIDEFEDDGTPKELSIDEFEAPEQYSPIESFGRGAFQSATLNFSDEIEGGMKAASSLRGGAKSLQDLVELYRASRDDARRKNMEAQRQNPKSYLAGDLTGGFANPIPGLGYAKGASALANLGKSVATGAIAGAGGSNADASKGQMGITEDAATGGMYGGAIHGLFGLANTVRKSVTPTKMANVLLNTPEEVTEEYIRRKTQIPDYRVENEPLRHEVATSFENDALPQLKNLVLEGSKESRNILDKEGVAYFGSEIAGKAKYLREGLEQRTQGINDDPGRVAAIKWLKHIEDEYSPKVTREAQSVESQFLDQYGNKIKNEIPREIEDQIIPTNRLKDSVQSIHNNTDWDIGGGRFARIDDNIKKELGHEFNDLLKRSPEYAKQMEGVAADTRLLNDARALAPSEKGFSNVFRRVVTDKHGAGQLPKETLAGVDKRLGTNYQDQIMGANMREAFDKSLTQGSRSVNMLSKALEGLPGGKFLGAITGGTIDKYGRKMAQGAVDYAIDLKRLMAQEGPQKAKEVLRPIIQAAQDGNPRAALIIHLLQKNSPGDFLFIENNEGQQ